MTTVNVRYMVDDVDAAVAPYTTHLGFELLSRRSRPSPTSPAGPGSGEGRRR